VLEEVPAVDVKGALLLTAGGAEDLINKELLCPDFGPNIDDTESY